jgi:hypothetical protein
MAYLDFDRGYQLLGRISNYPISNENAYTGKRGFEATDFICQNIIY